MANRNNTDLNKTETNSFVKGLNKDSDSSFIQEGMWTHARNVVNNTIEGNLGTLSAEPANYLCATVGTTAGPGTPIIIGAIHLYSDKWVIFTGLYQTGQGFSSNSEIGLFEEDTCTYRVIVQDPCLNFNKFHLIYGAAREKEDCSWAVYWNDGFNPDRYLNVGDPQTWPSKDYIYIGNNTYTNGTNQLQWPGVTWIQRCKDSTDTYEISPGVWPVGHPVDCIFCEDTAELDCDKLRLARLMSTPCVNVAPGKSGGSIRNGSYFAVIAYSIKGQKVTDWFSPSNVQPIWYEGDSQGSLEITIEVDKANFEEFILAIVQTINQGTVAKQIGIYSTNTETIYLDQISESLVTIPIEQIPIQTPVFEKSDQIVEVNNYLLRVGPTSKFEFNYQPLANLIRAKWVSVEYPSDYYVNGGYKPSYLRDEVYAFFIRWVYNTGDKSVSYHIPGRAPIGNELAPAVGSNVLFTDPTEQERNFEVFNTATITAVNPPEILDDGGRIIARGDMGYWESTEYYPDNKPEVWNSSAQCWTAVDPGNPLYDLCGKPIRHHKFPDNVTAGSFATNHFNTDPVTGLTSIRLMGVEFENIICPKDNEGRDIQGIVGYEILRGSREGSKTIIAKGMLNNLRPYSVKGPANQNRKGLYPNHPFNTIVPINPNPSTDPDIEYPYTGGPLNQPGEANDPYIRITDNNATINVNLSDIPRNFTTFHSPDTNFRNPFLSTVELKLYGNLRGISEQFFIEPDQQPKQKLISDLATGALILAGALEAILSIGGDVNYTEQGGQYEKVYGLPFFQGTLTPGPTGQAYNANTIGNFNFINPLGSATSIFNAALDTYFTSGGAILDAFTGYNGLSTIYNTYRRAGNVYTAPSVSYQNSAAKLLGIASAVAQTLYYFSEGAELALRILYSILPYRQYALQMIAEGYYNQFASTISSELFRFRIQDSLYLKDNIQDLKPYSGNQFRVNNLKRQKTVLLRTTSGGGSNTGPYFIPDNVPGSDYYYDQSLVTIGTARNNNIGNVEFEENNKTSIIQTKIASHYGGIKVRLRNQYGQLGSIKQIPITPCEQKIDLNAIIPRPTGKYCHITNCSGAVSHAEVQHKVINKTPVLFNGDTYVNRYTEKNSMFFFYDWLYGQPDGFEYNYFLRQMLPEPRFWLNSQRYEVSDLFNISSILNPPPGAGWLPSAFHQLDNRNYDYENDNEGNTPGVFGVKESYFYLSTSAIRDFYVESDVIVDYREAGPEPFQKFYNPYAYTDLVSLFNINPDWITRGNYYAYDYSLSIGKLYTQYFSQGNLQSGYYDPNVASLCYTHYPDRVIYSLPQTFESSKDSWFVYLANNYKEFKDQISGIKNFARTGIFITFKNSSPLLFQGVDQLQTEGGVKVTLGDGGLFNQTPQSVSIADAPFEYGSCQNKNSVIATPAGMFYISQNQGKIFKFGQDLDEVSQLGLKWWFVLYLPYKLTEDFPEYPFTDNAVAGIGCQTIYSNRDNIVYFSKKDYKLKEAYKGRTVYDPCKNLFVVDNFSRFELGDPFLFENASWTVSFDPKSNFFISFHDWHPDMVIPSKNTFMTTKNNGIWVHGDSCTQFCNFYGQPEVMEIELPITTGQTITTLRNVEYILECYKRYNCVDQFHILDQNFDHAFVYNSEQVSGHLHLNLFPKNNISLSLQYPIINPNSIDILFAKEENKYRFNQFWDITKDRGEFPIGSDYPPTGPVIPGTTILAGPKADQRTWITEPNGYIRDLNAANLDYNKPALERKKFRHYLNYLVLRKDVVGDTDMILKLTNTKQVYSPR
jgi:hypothetical protein